jgi:hypothetical protein
MNHSHRHRSQNLLGAGVTPARASLPAAPEPQLPADFATRVIAQADRIRSRQRHTRIAVGAAAALAAIAVLVRGLTPNNQTATNHSIAPSTEFVALSSTELADASSNETAYTTSDEDPNLLTTMMPDATQAETFDANYGPAGWTTYASWNPVSYDSER